MDTPSLVLGFTGENQNGALALSTEGLNHLLGTYGIEAHHINTTQPDWNERLKSFITTRPVLFAYGFAGVGSVLRNGDQSFWTAFKTPFLSFMYDHPFYNLPNHMVDSPYVACCYFIADYAEARKNFVPNPHPFFLMREGYASSTGDHLLPGHWRKRSIPYIFAKTGGDQAKMDASIAELDNAERQLFHECREALQKFSDLIITDLVAVRAREIKFPNGFSKNMFGRLVVLLDRYMRDWRSRRLVEWLKHKPAIIIGDGWDDVDKTNTRAQFLPSRPMPEVDALYRDTRFVFNANPYSRDGYHERVTMAVSAGAVAVSDRNRFSNQNFAPMRNFIGFDFGDPDWGSKLAARLVAFEGQQGDFDPREAQNHLTTVFPVDQYVENLVGIAAKIRRNAAGNP